MTTSMITTESKVKTSFDWRLFGVLLGMVAFSLFALIPYGLTLAGQTFSTEMLPQLLAQFIGQIILYSLLIWVGLKLGSGIGLEAPWLEGRLKGDKTSASAKTFGSVILIGLVA